MSVDENTDSGFGFKFPPKEEVIEALLDLSKPIAQRMRAVFYLRTMGGDDSIAALCKALGNKEGTCLFRHEIAYVLGQMQAKQAIPALVAVLEDSSDDPIVRHESGEALGAIAEPSTLPVLEKFSNDERPEVSETCQIAADRLRWVIERGETAAAEGNFGDNPYESIDPAPAAKKPANKEVPDFAKQLTDPTLTLFDRYKAMFSLRNNGSTAAVKALCTGLKDSSPLFRHEVAYVLGQMAHPASAEALKESVLDPAEHDMVRHEAAEALGAIGTSECVEFLEKYASAEALMLRESCIVALDSADYFSNPQTGLGEAVTA